MTLSRPTGSIQIFSAALLALGMTVTVGTALAFQHLGGFIPCMLCLEQRTPYYLGIPLMLAAAVCGIMRGPAVLTRGLLLVGAGLMLWGMWMGVYHAGVEWSFWPGPADCGAVAAPTDTGGEGVLDAIDQVVPPSCDQAAGRFLGLSFAGWNVIASAILAAIAIHGAFAGPSRGKA